MVTETSQKDKIPISFNRGEKKNEQNQRDLRWIPIQKINYHLGSEKSGSFMRKKKKRRIFNTMKLQTGEFLRKKENKDVQKHI